MAGGLIEGIQKVYSGPNVLKKHLILFAICFVIGIISIITSAHLPEKATDAQIYSYLIFKAPLLGIGLLISFSVVGLYSIAFSHNAIKLQVWKDTEKDPARVKALAILPEWNSNLFKPLIELIIFSVVWGIIIALTVGCGMLFGAIPLIGLIPLILMIIYTLILSFTYPFMLSLFSQHYSAKNLLSPFLLFSVFTRVFVPALILYLKSIIYWIVVTLIIYVLVFLTIIISSSLGKAGLFITMSLFMYIVFVANLGFTYAVAVIIHEKYILDCD